MTARAIGRTALARGPHPRLRHGKLPHSPRPGAGLHGLARISLELAAIPFPDEPPIRYPSRAAWRDITAKRGEDKSVDLANPAATRSRSHDALDAKVEKFRLHGDASCDVIAEIEDSQGIPVEFDTKALRMPASISRRPLPRACRASLFGSAPAAPAGGSRSHLPRQRRSPAHHHQGQGRGAARREGLSGGRPRAAGKSSSGLNPFQTGGGLGGAGGINSGMGGGGGMGMGGGGGMGMGGGTGGGAFQVADARERVAAEAGCRSPRQPSPSAGEAAARGVRLGLPSSITAAETSGSVPRLILGLGSGSEAGSLDDKELAIRMARVRATAPPIWQRAVRSGGSPIQAVIEIGTPNHGRPRPWLLRSRRMASREQRSSGAARQPTSPPRRSISCSWPTILPVRRRRSVAPAVPAGGAVATDESRGVCLGHGLAADGDDAAAPRMGLQRRAVAAIGRRDQKDIADPAARLAKATIERLDAAW